MTETQSQELVKYPTGIQGLDDILKVKKP